MKLSLVVVILSFVVFFTQTIHASSNVIVKSHQKISDTEGGFTGTLQDIDRFGESVISIGDLDEDGIPDMAVGAPNDNGLPGSVWILFMRDDGTVKSHQEISSGVGGFTHQLSGGDFFGSTIENLGDLDGDGIIDIAVGALGSDTGGFNYGALFILFLNTDGTVKKHQEISDTRGGIGGILGINSLLGSSIANLGDLDGDGVIDISVGGLADSDGGVQNGAIWTFFLNTDGTVKSHQKISNTEGGFTGILSDKDRFGSSVANLGDLDGDGVVDIAVGAIWDDNGGTDRGAVWIIFLNTDGTVKLHQKISNTEGGFTGVLDNDDRLGYSVANLGDFDGDGIVDLAIGASKDDDGGIDRGAIWIMFLNTDGTVKSHQKISNTVGGFIGVLDDDDRFGSAIANLGDFDGDGVIEIAVGASQDDDGGINRGAVWVLSSKEKNPFPLYTQIKSSHPSITETSSWAGDTFARGAGKGEINKCETIAKCGCAITSLVMMARSEGVLKGVDGEDVNPGTLNEWLIDNKGYDKQGNVFWSRAVDYFGVEEKDVISTPFELVNHKVIQKAKITNNVSNGKNVLGFSASNGHYFYLTDTNTTGFDIADPHWYNTKTTGDTNDLPNFVRGYKNKVNRGVIYSFSEATVQTGVIEATLNSPAELLLIDDEGNRTGFVKDHRVVEEIDNSGYVQDEFIRDQDLEEDENQHLTKRILKTKANGKYELRVIGTGTGPYTLTLSLKTGAGQHVFVEIEGETEAGQVDEYVIDLEAGEVELDSGEEIVSDREAFIALVMKATGDERRNVQRFFVRFANRIFDSIDREHNRLAQLKLRVFKKLLLVKNIDDEELNEGVEKLSQQLR